MPDHTQDSGPFEAAIDALLAEAAKSGPGAATAARRAAVLAEGRDPTRAARAHALAARLDPLDAFPKLALARLHAEAGDLPAARREAQAVLAGAVDEAARARAAFILGELARSQGDAAGAREHYAMAVRIEDALLRTAPDDPAAARWYARATGRIAELDAKTDLAKAMTGAEGALAILRALTAQIGEPPMLAADIADAEFRMAAMTLDRGQARAARRHVGEAIGRYEALIIVEPDEAHWRAVLAEAWALAAEAALQLNTPEETVGAIDRALRLRLKLAAGDPNERGGLAALWRLRGALFAALGDGETATHSLTQAAALSRTMLREAGDADAARFHVNTLLEHADHALAFGALEIARDAASEARATAEPFAQRKTDAARPWITDLARAWTRLGRVSRAAGAPAQAQECFARAVAFQRMLYEAKPEPASKNALASALITIGDAALATRQHSGARGYFVEAFQLRLELAEAAPGEAEPARALAMTLERLGLAAAASGDATGARAVWEEELALINSVFEDPCDEEGQRLRAVIEAHLASLNGLDAAELRASALARLDVLAEDGKLTPRDIELRKQLWHG